MVGQGDLKARPKDDVLLKCKKCKVSSKETIVDSKMEAKEDIVMAEPEAVRSGNEARAGSARALPEVTDGSELTCVLWVIAADLRGI